MRKEKRASYTFTMRAEDKLRWEQCADEADMSLAAWLRAACQAKEQTHVTYVKKTAPGLAGIQERAAVSDAADDPDVKKCLLCSSPSHHHNYCPIGDRMMDLRGEDSNASK